MSDDERRHLDNLAIGIMTLTTVIVAGMFGLLGFAAWDKQGSEQLIEWAMSLSAALAAVGYFVCVTTGVDVIDDSSADKVRRFRALTNGFLFTAGTVVLVATLVVISPVELTAVATGSTRAATNLENSMIEKQWYECADVWKAADATGWGYKKSFTKTEVRILFPRMYDENLIALDKNNDDRLCER